MLIQPSNGLRKEDNIMKILWISLGLLAFLLFNSFYIVDEREQALVFQFKKVVAVRQDAGLYLKIPFVETITYYDKRILNFDAQDIEVPDLEQKQLTVNAYAKYRITNPLKFYQEVTDERGASFRLDKIFEARLRDAISSVLLSTLLTEKRADIMQKIKVALQEKTRDFGIEIWDVRIVRADLPKENSDAIYKRMRAEREKEAREFRAKGAEEAQRITSLADKERRVLLAEAQKESEIIRGRGEAKATKIFADAFGKDEDFYSFYRSMNAYKNTLRQDDTTMVLSPDSDFLKFFDSLGGE